MRLERFNSDYNWMFKEKTGYFPWLERREAKLRLCLLCCENNPVSNTDWCILQKLFKEPFSPHPLLDIFYKALIRSELRLIRRYIPQNSHEERLTGHFVSEIESAVEHIGQDFENIAEKLYGEKRGVDFFYMDLSSNSNEKITGADLGFIVFVDLPDMPLSVNLITLQAKKIYSGGASAIGKQQFDALKQFAEQNKCTSAYLFYDMKLNRLCSPLVWESGQMPHKTDKKSFQVADTKVVESGTPFSLFMLDMLTKAETAKTDKDFDASLQTLIEKCRKIGVLTLGRKLEIGIDTNKTEQEENEGKEKPSENAVTVKLSPLGK